MKGNIVAATYTDQWHYQIYCRGLAAILAYWLKNTYHLYCQTQEFIEAIGNMQLHILRSE